MSAAAGTPRTLFEKIWDAHLVSEEPDGTSVLYIDRHLILELSTPQAFEGLRLAGIGVRRPDKTLGVIDHVLPTIDRDKPMADAASREVLEAMVANCREHGIELYGVDDPRQGIVHIVGPEQGFTVPGVTLCAGDSHTSTHGAFGALAFGVGTTQVEHILATQTMRLPKPKAMRVTVTGTLPEHCTGKDVVLAIIGRIGIAGGTGHVIEYAGPVIEDLSMEGRMTVSNMTIEAGARAGMIAPDEKTYAYVKGRPKAPQGADWDAALAYWRTLPTDVGATFDREVTVDVSGIDPQVTWGTTPEQVVPITGAVPDPRDEADPGRRALAERAIAYMGLKPGQRITDVSVDHVFIGSCTNSRIEDLRAAAAIARGRTVADGVRALVVPGSGLIKRQAESEGLDRIFTEAGFEWREPGCSMCIAMNGDFIGPGERCASTSNRNFEGRQGRGGRTHLLSPAMAAAAAIAGRLADARDYV